MSSNTPFNVVASLVSPSENVIGDREPIRRGEQPDHHLRTVAASVTGVANGLDGIANTASASDHDTPASAPIVANSCSSPNSSHSWRTGAIVPIMARHRTSNDQLLPTTIVSAAVNRFMHHSHVAVTDCDSYRFARAREGKGVMPLP
jgi:hypothetical protein